MVKVEEIIYFKNSKHESQSVLSTDHHRRENPINKFRKVTEKDNFLILASDGLWDFLSDTECVETLAPHVADPAADLSQILMDKVIERAAKEARLNVKQLTQLPAGSVRRRLHDDTTVVVVRL